MSTVEFHDSTPVNVALIVAVFIALWLLAFCLVCVEHGGAE